MNHNLKVLLFEEKGIRTTRGEPLGARERTCTNWQFCFRCMLLNAWQHLQNYLFRCFGATRNYDIQQNLLNHVLLFSYCIYYVNKFLFWSINSHFNFLLPSFHEIKGRVADLEKLHNDVKQKHFEHKVCLWYTVLTFTIFKRKWNYLCANLRYHVKNRWQMCNLLCNTAAKWVK